MPKSRPSATRAPMAGRIDSSDYGLNVRGQRHLEDRQWRRAEAPQAAAPFDPLADSSDCVHGCNGDCVESGSERCTFACHEHAEAPAVDAGA